MLKLSVSSMGTYKKCPKQYHYRYIEKPQVDKKKWVHTEFGSCAHKILEYFHQELMTKVIPPSEYGKLMSECFAKAVPEFDEAILEPELDFLHSSMKYYLEKMKDNGIPPVESIEKEFNLNIEGLIVRGFIDRIDRISEDTFHVVDYKTTKNKNYLEPFQLQVYGLAIKNFWPEAKYINGSYCLLKYKCDMMTWKITEEDLKNTRDTIIKTGADIEFETKWQKKPSKLCDFCDFYDLCQGSMYSWDK